MISDVTMGGKFVYGICPKCKSKNIFENFCDTDRGRQDLGCECNDCGHDFDNVTTWVEE